jgi:hypothetical protein
MSLEAGVTFGTYSFTASLRSPHLSGFAYKAKAGTASGSMSRRWLLLKEHALYYCEDSAAYEPAGAVDLEGYSVHAELPPSGMRPCLEVG